MSDQEVIAEEQITEAEESEVTETAVSTAETPEPEAPIDQAQDEAPTATAEPAESSPEEFSILTLKPREHLPGKVKNITQFGAFIDIGLPQDGLVHISELARHKVEKVEDVVSVGQEVDVWVKKVDTKRGRISLTMVKPIKFRLRDIKEGADLDGVVTRIESYGAFVDIDSERDGLVHISQITHDYINHPQDALAIGDEVKVKVLKVNRKKRQVDLSIKALLPPPVTEQPAVETPVEKEAEPEPEVQDEPVPTAMAIAFASLNNKEDDSQAEQEAHAKEREKRQQEQDDIISRTLATSN